MPNIAPGTWLHLPKIRNSHLPRAEHVALLDADQAFLAAVQRSPHPPISVGAPLIEDWASSGDPLRIYVTIPPFCKAVAWGVICESSGDVYARGQGETYYAYIRCESPQTVSDEPAPYVYWSGTLRDDTPSSNFIHRPLNMEPSTEGLPEQQYIDVYLDDDDPSGSVFRVYSLLFWPLPRMAAEPLISS